MSAWTWILTIFVTDATGCSTFITRCTRLNSWLKVITCWQKAIIVINLNLILIYVWIYVVSQLLFFLNFIVQVVINIFRQLELRNLIYEPRILYFSIIASSVFQFAHLSFLSCCVLWFLFILWFKCWNVVMLGLCFEQKAIHALLFSWVKYLNFTFNFLKKLNSRTLWLYWALLLLIWNIMKLNGTR